MMLYISSRREKEREGCKINLFREAGRGRAAGENIIPIGFWIGTIYIIYFCAKVDFLIRARDMGVLLLGK